MGGKRIFVSALLALFTIALFSLAASTASAKTFRDNFSTDSGLWTYIGDAYRDTKNEYVVLTEPKNWQVGVIWLKEEISAPFTAKFRYKAGGGTGADGLVFIFYKNTNYTPCGHRYLGFTACPGSPGGDSVPGYGIEFDNYDNWEFDHYVDPSGNHIALIKDHAKNHIIYVNDSRTEDNKWHNVTVEVDVSSVKVVLDGETLFTWSGTLNRTFGGIGFSASTGFYNNWHIIDDVEIITYEDEAYPSVSVDTDKTNYTLGEVVRMHLAISGGELPVVTKFKLEHQGPEGTELLYESAPFILSPNFSLNRTVPFPIPVSPFVAGGSHTFIATLVEPTTGTIIARDSTSFYINDTFLQKRKIEMLA